MGYSYPIDPSWTRDELLSVMALFQIVEKAYEKLEKDQEGAIRGPKALGCFGAPYIWAIFLALGVVEDS